MHKILWDFEIETVKQVHCSWSRLPRRGLEFHVCTINKGSHTKKVGKLIEDTMYTELPKLCFHPGWRLMGAGYFTCFHTLF